MGEAVALSVIWVQQYLPPWLLWGFKQFSWSLIILKGSSGSCEDFSCYYTLCQLKHKLTFPHLYKDKKGTPQQMGHLYSSVKCKKLKKKKKKGLQCKGKSWKVRLWWGQKFKIFGCAGSSLLCTGFLQLWLRGSRIRAQQLWRSSIAAPWHVGSS